MYQTLKTALPLLGLLLLPLTAHADGFLQKGDTAHPVALQVQTTSGSLQNGDALVMHITSNGSSSTITGTGTFTQPDTTNQPGIEVYTLSTADAAALAYGDAIFQPSDSTTPANIINPVRVEIVAFNPFDPSLLGLTGVATAAALATSNSGITTANSGITANSAAIAAVAPAVWTQGSRTVTGGTVGTVTNPVVASSVTGTVGSVTGSVGSVTGPVVASSVTGSVGSVTGSVGSVTTPVTLASSQAFSNSVAGTVAPTWYTAPPTTVVVGGYAAGQDPATLILAAPLFPGLTMGAAWGDIWAASAGPVVDTYAGSVQTNVFTTPAGAGQHTTTLTTNSAGKPVGRTVTHP